MGKPYPWQIREGMEVWSSDGEALGPIVAVGPDSFVIEKGIFFPRDHTLSLREVREVRQEAVILSRSRGELEEEAVELPSRQRIIDVEKQPIVREEVQITQGADEPSLPGVVEINVPAETTPDEPPLRKTGT